MRNALRHIFIPSSKVRALLGLHNFLLINDESKHEDLKVQPDVGKGHLRSNKEAVTSLGEVSFYEVQNLIDLLATAVHDISVDLLVRVMFLVEDRGPDDKLVRRTVGVVVPVEPLIDQSPLSSVIAGIPVVWDAGELRREIFKYWIHKGRIMGSTNLVHKILADRMRFPKCQLTIHQRGNSTVGVNLEVFFALLLPREEIDIDLFERNVAVKEEDVHKSARRRQGMIVKLKLGVHSCLLFFACILLTIKSLPFKYSSVDVWRKQFCK